MSFMDSYKHLEKLCRDIYREEKPIKAYIEAMKSIPRGAYYVSGWEEDLRRLKHYLWVRNQISHEPGCSEENMCSPEDALWLDDFHARIMNEIDPLTLYRKATQSRYTPAQKKTDSPYDQRKDYNYYQTTNKRSGCGTALFIVVVMIAAIALWWLLKA